MLDNRPPEQVVVVKEKTTSITKQNILLTS